MTSKMSEAEQHLKRNYIVAVIRTLEGRITDVKVAGSGHIYPVEKVIQWIRDCGYEFLTVSPGGTPSRIDVRRHGQSEELYIQTVKDNKATDNLESLPSASL